MKPVLFYCNSMPLLSIADQRRMTCFRETMCSANRVLRTLGRLCSDDFSPLAATYNKPNSITLAGSEPAPN